MLALIKTPALICLLVVAMLVVACGGSSEPGATSAATVFPTAIAIPTPIPTPSAPGTPTVPPAPTSAPPTPSATPEGLWEKRLDELATLSWRLVELDGEAIPADPLVFLELGRIEFSRLQLFGRVGCWEYGATIDLVMPGLAFVDSPEGERLKLFPRGCADPDERPALVDDYFAALSAGDSYRATDQRLEIVDSDGTTRLAYEPLQPAQRPKTLTGTTWMLRTLRGDEPLPGVGVTLQIIPDGVTGSDGCNSYSAGATVSGDGVLRFPEPSFMQTAMACDDDIMMQSQAYLASLHEADSYRLEGDRLEILDRNGETLLAFAEPGIADLAGATWTLVTIVGSDAMLEDVDVTLSIDGATGRLTGSSGCNQYNGSVTIDGSRIGIDDVLSTLKDCPDPPGIIQQERLVLDILDHVTTWDLDGALLRLMTSDHRALVWSSRM